MSNRQIDRLSHLKSERGVIKTGFPSKEEGVDGNIEIRYVPGYGLILFAFYAGNWYISKMELQKISKDKKKLSVDRLKVNEELDLDKNPIKNLDPDKVQGAERWNSAYTNLNSGEFSPKFKDINVGVIKLVDVDGILQVKDLLDNDAILKAKRLQVDAGTASTTANAFGELLFDSDNDLFMMSSTGIIISSTLNGTRGDISAVVVQSHANDAYLSLMDGATRKWSMGYDKTNEVFTDATCVLTDESTAVSFTHGQNMDTHGVQGAPISGTGIPSDTFIDSIDASANTLVLTNAATVTGTQTLTSQKADSGLIFDSSPTFGNAIKMKLDHALDDASAVLSLFYNSTNYATLTTAANGATTIATADSDGTVGHLILDAAGKIELNADSGTVLIKDDAASHFLFDCDNTMFKIYDDTNANDYFSIVIGAEGATTISTVDADSAIGHLILDPDGHIGLNKAAVFPIHRPAYGDVIYTANTGNNTDVDFRTGNKAKLTLTGGATVAELGFVFPDDSGNFSLILSQDGSGSGVVTDYKVYTFEGDDATSHDLLWAGGSDPTLTTTASKADIISIFWDSHNEIAYGTYTYNF